MNLRWTKAARTDREAMYAYVEANDPQAALRLDKRIVERANQLLRLPYLGRLGRVSGTRELSIVKSSCVLVYRVEAEVVWIVRLIHTARAWPDEAE